MAGEGFLSRRATRSRRQFERAGDTPAPPLPASSAAATAPVVLEYNECQEVVKRLNDHLSHELKPDEAAIVQEHLSKCLGCFSRFHFEETLLHTIRERAQTIQAPDTLRRNLMDLLKKQESSSAAPPASAVSDAPLPSDGASSEDVV